MKRGVKFFLLIGLVCFAVGIIGAALSFKTWDMNEGLANVDVEKKISAANIDTLSIQTDISKVTFIPSDTNEIKVHLVGMLSKDRAKDCTIEAVTEGSNAWRVDVCKDRKKIHINFDLTELKSLILNRGPGLRTEVALPDKMFKAITVASDTGSINFKEVKAEKLTASADTGSITIESYIGKQLSAQTDTGRITVGEGQGEVKLKTDTGSISAKLHDIGDSVTLQSDTGSIRLQLDPPPAGASFDLATDVGSVHLDIPDVTMTKQSHNSIKGTIGDGSKKIFLRTDTGSINVSGK
ncbi:DUF4097 family beta strand repeat-containing protein [Paenibacillus sp. N3.4]|uniref:DUF4097 family beta strand repeat-containing protein n=1 Tax=Paenibacillus sp. N3.4 TaxID=2603222 RepID=UPI0011C8D600|nr:DUF4097 family beta strand repeat-containing protein [Paenibacillus sp. N3.4]TXK80931.1 DUF4097 domain-containing protein [Paenibacillus sp. N3.4]